MNKQINILREFSVPLIAGVIIAMIWANIAPDKYSNFIHTELVGSFSYHFFSNDLFMMIFFALAAVEITQSVVPGGDLHPLKKAINPLIATAGGIVGPVAVYLGLNSVWGSPDLVKGWGIPTATDIALAWLAARVVFGRNHPVIAYILLLAIADDAVGLVVIALFYPDPTAPVVLPWLALTGAGTVIAMLLRFNRVRSYWHYLLLGGIPSWLGLYKAHLHPALALVFIIPFIPHRHYERRHLFEEDPSDRSPLARFEHEWKVIVDFGLFFFGLANAGLEFSALGKATWLVLSALLVGKTVGIFSFGILAAAIGFPLPRGMYEKDLVVAGMVAGIGFTVSLFIAGEAFVDPVHGNAAKMGALFSISAFLVAFVMGKVFGIRKLV